MLKVLLEQLSEIVDGLDPDAIPLCEVPELWKGVQLGGAAGLGEDTARPPGRRRRHVAKDGFRSAADQLRCLSGTSINDAKKPIETSKRVKKLPKTANAMRKGKLSPAKAEAIAGCS